MANEYDAIVIGGGHNGLVAGAYLAPCGARAVVLEARQRRAEPPRPTEPWPDAPEFKVTTLSYVMSLMPDTILRDLHSRGTATGCTRWARYFVPFPDGRCWSQYDERRANYEEFAKFSKADADALERWEAWIEGVAEVLGPLLMTTPPKLGSRATARSPRAAAPRVGDPGPRRRGVGGRHAPHDHEHHRPRSSVGSSPTR